LLGRVDETFSLVEGDCLGAVIVVMLISVVVFDELSLLLLKSSMGFGRVDDLLVGVEARQE